MASKLDKLAKLAEHSMQDAPGLNDRVSSVTDRFNRAKTVAPAYPVASTFAGESAAQSSADAATSFTEATVNSEYVEVPIRLIDDNPYNARHNYDMAIVKDYAESMKKDGQLVPGIATLRNGRYLLIAGHYRKLSLGVAGKSTMKLVIQKDVSDRTLYEMSYKENAERSPQTPVDNAFAWRKLLDNKIYEREEDIAAAIGMSPANVNKTLAILKMEPETLVYIGQHATKFGATILYELYLLEQAAGNLAARDAARRVVEEELSRKELQQIREDLAQQKPRKIRENARPYKLGEKGKIGSLREWESGRILMDIQIEDPAMRQAIIEELRQRFKNV